MILEFLEARIAEDEEVAQAAIDAERPGTHWQWVDEENDAVILEGELQTEARWDSDNASLMISLRTEEHFPMRSDDRPLPAFVLPSIQWDGGLGSYDHIARWDPARVLAECAAKRAIVNGFRPHPNARDLNDVHMFIHAAILPLAQPYADHPDFDPAWRLDGA